MKSISEIHEEIKSTFSRWGDDDNYRPTATALVRVMPLLINLASLEKSKGGLNESDKSRLADIITTARYCNRHLKEKNDRHLSNQLAAKIAHFDAAYFGVDEQIQEPFIHELASGGFKFAVKNVVSKLPTDIQRRIGKGCYFMELSQNHVLGVYCPGGSLHNILITSGLTDKMLEWAIAHECAHFIRGDSGSNYQIENETDKLANQWGFYEPKN